MPRVGPWLSIHSGQAMRTGVTPISRFASHSFFPPIFDPASDRFFEAAS
jgi:hypothetical protein